MCGTYGLSGRYIDEDVPFGLAPMDEPENRVLLAGWLTDWGGKATRTGTSSKGTNLHPIIYAGEGGRVLELAWWWFHRGGKPAKYAAFNSRDDALVARWSDGFQHRALIPADWYLEGGKRWALPGGELFAIAAIMSPRDLPDGGTGISYSMVTRAGIGEASQVVTARGDSRMPLLLPAELHDTWLDPERRGDASLVDLVQAGSQDISEAVTTAAGLPAA